MQTSLSRLTSGALVLAAGLAFSSTLPAAGPDPFIAKLSSETQAEAGLTLLSTDQQKEVDRLIHRELELARQGNVRAFAGTFISRRSPAELEQTSLKQLTPAQQDQLNRLVSDALANRADTAPAYTYSPKRDGEEPLAVAMKRKLIVHGGMSFTAGWGSNGSNFQGASAYSTFTDPQSKTSLTVGVSSYRGKGYFGYPGYGFGYGGLGYNYFDDYPGSYSSWRRGLSPYYGEN